ncbi:PucR family transcriptional regulator [Clostridium sp. DL1XJH146]
MFVRCSDILQLPSLKTLDLVAGGYGIEREISWFYVAECYDDSMKIKEWLSGGELVYITGSGLKGELELVDFIKMIDDKKAAGLIINIGEYFKTIPNRAIEVANKLNVPLFKIPWEVKLIDISQDICSYIIKKNMENESQANLLGEILFSNFNSENSFIEQAYRLDFDISNSNLIGILEIADFGCSIEKKSFSDKSIIINIQNRIQKIVYNMFLRSNIKVITIQKNYSIIFMLSMETMDKIEISRIFREIKGEVNNRIDKLNIIMGVGSLYNSSFKMKDSLEEAKEAILIARSKLEGLGIEFYEDLGIYKFILNITDKNLCTRYFDEVLGLLIEYDNMNKSNMLETLETFLKENCNIAIASQKLFIHKNSLRYRIQKIEEILKCDLNRLDDCIKLDFAFKIYRIKKIH